MTASIRRVVVEHEQEVAAESFSGHVVQGPLVTTLRVDVHGLTAAEAAHLRDDARALVARHVDLHNRRTTS